MNGNLSTAVFLGPSLSHEQAREIITADFYPPAQMGDIYRILSYGVSTIVLIDGVFHTVPSVWHRELLDALGEGVRVIGAGSMGALRAAELYQYGMIGCGTIFEWYRDGMIDGDDEVALLHGPADSGFVPLTEPLVNMRVTLSCAVKDGRLAADQADQLTAYAKALYYQDRTFHRLMECPALASWSDNDRQQLSRYLHTRRVNLKQQDARLALYRAAELMDSTAPSNDLAGVHLPAAEQPATKLPPPQHNLLWQKERVLHTRFVGAWGEPTGEQILAALQQDADLRSSLYPTLSMRRFVLEWAKQNRICTADNRPMTEGQPWNEQEYGAMLARYARQWQQIHQLIPTDAWLRANGLTFATYWAALAERAIVDWVVEQGPTLLGVDESPGSESDGQQAMQRRFVLAWACQNGVRGSADRLETSESQGSTEQAARQAECALTDWVVEQGPPYFGLLWHWDLAVLRELQMTGQLDGKLRHWYDR